MPEDLDWRQVTINVATRAEYDILKFLAKRWEAARNLAIGERATHKSSVSKRSRDGVGKGDVHHMRPEIPIRARNNVSLDIISSCRTSIHKQPSLAVESEQDGSHSDELFENVLEPQSHTDHMIELEDRLPEHTQREKEQHATTQASAHSASDSVPTEPSDTTHEVGAVTIDVKTVAMDTSKDGKNIGKVEIDRVRTEPDTGNAAERISRPLEQPENTQPSQAVNEEWIMLDTPSVPIKQSQQQTYVRPAKTLSTAWTGRHIRIPVRDSEEDAVGCLIDVANRVAHYKAAPC